MKGWKITGILIDVLASPCSPIGAEEWATALADLHLKAWVYKIQAPLPKKYHSTIFSRQPPEED